MWSAGDAQILPIITAYWPNLSRDNDIEAIPGSPPDLRRLPAGCGFAPRCVHAQTECRVAVPDPRYPTRGRMARCVRVADDDASQTWTGLQASVSRANVAGN
jgi:oligopeptide/dipeptide ABC transporter ATP-binding protein